MEQVIESKPDKDGQAEFKFGLSFPVLFQKAEARMLEQPGKPEKIPAVEVTFIGVFSEEDYRTLVRMIREHKLLVKAEDEEVSL